MVANNKSPKNLLQGLHGYLRRTRGGGTDKLNESDMCYKAGSMIKAIKMFEFIVCPFLKHSFKCIKPSILQLQSVLP